MTKFIAICTLLCAPLLTWAQLAPAQIATLKTTCLADVLVCKPLLDAADDVGLAGYFNSDSQTYIVWRPSVTETELLQDSQFNWTRVDNLTTGKACIWEWMFKPGAISPSSLNIRAGIDATWVGTAADLAVRDTIYAMCKRSATRAEKALASGAGTTAAPSVLTWIGPISYADASLIRS